MRSDMQTTADHLRFLFSSDARSPIGRFFHRPSDPPIRQAMGRQLKASVPLSRICFRLFTMDIIEQSRTIWNQSARLSFLSKRNRYHPYNILNYLRIPRKLFSFCLINPQLSCFVRKMSVKSSETIVIDLHIIGNTSLNNRTNSHTLYFHHSDLFQFVDDRWIYLCREQSEKYSAKSDRGLRLSSQSLYCDYDWMSRLVPTSSHSGVDALGCHRELLFIKHQQAFSDIGWRKQTEGQSSHTPSSC